MMGNQIEETAAARKRLHCVLNNIKNVVERRNKIDITQQETLLVAASKTQPASNILPVYDAGQRHFGENYINELHDKATDAQILNLCTDIHWHFIGKLQSNKVNKLLSTPRLYMVQTIDSQKIADLVNKQWAKCRKDDRKLNVMVQVNTSAEEAKNGIEPSQVTDLVRHVWQHCPNLAFKGLMTIGQYNYDMSLGPNPDFTRLADCRQDVCRNLHLEHRDVELSMGMSTDYEHAVEVGATTVRVGVSIFGPRLRKVSHDLS